VKKILLAIVDKDVRRLLKFKLSKQNYYVLLTGSGERAVELVASERPVMVIVDSSLPGLDGYEICRQIRRQSRLSHTLVIFLTIFGEELKFREGLERGADDYMLKPVDLEQLVNRINVLMRRNSEEDGQSPLTGLPGPVPLQREIKRRIDWQEKFALCALNTDYFRAYNEVYGFDFGDRAIRHLAENLTRVREEVKPKGFYLGHMRADTFFVLLKPGYVERYCQEVILGFERLRPELFTRTDLERGHIVTADRTGRMRRFALLALSIGAITSERRSFKCVQEAMDAALWAMHKAKTRWGSNYYLRRDGAMGLIEARDNGGSKKILVVDDDSLSRRLLKLKLEKEGYSVQMATTGPQAVEIVREDPPDLIFLSDSTLETDSCRTVLYLKKDVRAARIPLVMLTSSAGQEKGRIAGADDCLVKPCSFKYLVRKAEKHLEPA
jgi:DNA-binding response OmpR family regulator